MRVTDAAELDGLDDEAIAARRDRGRRPRGRGLPAHAAAADRSARAHQAAQPRAAPPGVRGLAQPGVGGGARQPPGRRAHRPAAGRAGPAAGLRHPRRRRPGRLDRPHHRGGRRDAGLDGPGVGGQRRGRGGGARRGGGRATASSWPPGTGRSTASGSAPSGTPSTPTALRPYFELDRVLVDGVFHAAELLYGYRFTPRPDLAGYHPDVRVWEVTDADGAAGRALPRRLLRPRGQARRRLDELVRPPVPAARHRSRWS